MAYPNVIYGKFGDEKVAQSTKIGGLPFGARMVLPDGREFVHASPGTAAVPGKVYVAGTVVGNHGCSTIDLLAVAAATIGVSTLTVTMGGTTSLTKDQYADGYVGVRTGTGEGQLYRVKSHNAAAAASTATITLEPGDEVVNAISASANVSLVPNPYSEIVLKTADTVYTGPVVGIPQVAISAGFFGWIQTKGLGMGLTAATVVVIGQPVVCDTAVAGAVGPMATAAGSAATTIEGQEAHILGHVRVVAEDTKYAVIDWNIN